MKKNNVVTCFLEYDEKILILRRSQRVGTYQGKWAGVSGYVEANPDRQAFVEIREETGLGEEDLILVKKGNPLKIPDKSKGILWIVHPYLFQVKDPTLIQIDWEHTEFKWIDPNDLTRFQTVPSLLEAYLEVRSENG